MVVVEEEGVMRRWEGGMWAKIGNRGGGMGAVVELALVVTVVEVVEVDLVVEVVVGERGVVEVLLVDVVGADNLWKNEVSKRDIF